MPTIGPYQLLHALGTCQVGDVWSAVDAGNNQVTVAVLKPENASDPALRDAFAMAANNLAQSRQVPIIAGDFSSPTPWIASATIDGSVVAQVFIAIGMTYQPIARSGEGLHSAGLTGAEPTQAVHLPPAPTSPASHPAHAAPEPGGPGPAPGTIPGPAAGTIPGPAPGTIPAPTAPPPISAPPGPVSAPPQPLPMPGWAPPLSDASPQDLTPIVVTPPDDGRGRRTGLLIGALVAGILVLGGTGGAIAFVMQPDPPTPPPPSPAASASVPVNPPSEAPPERPGKEPTGGEWPATFAAFGPGEATERMAGLPGLSFDFEVPDGWECVDESSGNGVVRYVCGPGGSADNIGGELVVRDCPDPCDSDTRVAMRRAQDAWGLQWFRDSGYRSWAEAEDLDGEGRYALIMLGYTRSTFEGRMDQQVVVRLTAPPDEAQTIQKVLSSIRDAIQEALTEK